MKPVIPRKIQLFLRRQLIFMNIEKNSARWPIDPQATKLPENWTGWPEGKRFAVALMHDVDTRKGYLKSPVLMKLDMEMGFRASFNFVPERDYTPTPEFRAELEKNGFEVCVHDLRHDGKLFRSEKDFRNSAQKINRYLEEWGSVGFRPGAMHSNLEWINLLNIEYDSSTFDTDPFEPKPIGKGTIFPFWVEEKDTGKGYVELPYTLPQDFTLFILMREKNINIWKEKLEWIVRHGGMALITVHPDYINFTAGDCSFEEYPVDYYRDFLLHIKETYEGQYWQALPKDIARFFRDDVVKKQHVE